MFEPVQGSAPDIAGKGIANPIATFWTASQMLSFFGEEQAAQAVMDAIEKVTVEGITLTLDLGGNANTVDVTKAVLTNILQNLRIRSVRYRWVQVC
jgi:tartrate dehydrogenase/decarboxylase/D-malate dehydrogenase